MSVVLPPRAPPLVRPPPCRPVRSATVGRRATEPGALLSAPPRQTAVLRRLRENGPVVLVPLAWGFVGAAHRGLVTAHTLLMAHVVMTGLLVAFAALSYGDMREGVLYAWWLVIVAGVPFTLAGLAGLALGAFAQPLLTTAVVGWMLLPAIGLLYTGRRVPAGEAPLAYTGGGALSLLGAVVYLAGLFVGGGSTALLAGLALVGLGQTAGIIAAVVVY